MPCISWTTRAAGCSPPCRRIRSDGAKTQLLDSFAERDLVADFKLDLDGGARLRFLMATGSLGRYSAGWAPLYVFETTTGQVAVYRMQVGQSYRVERLGAVRAGRAPPITRPAGAAARP